MFSEWTVSRKHPSEKTCNALKFTLAQTLGLRWSEQSESTNADHQAAVDSAQALELVCSGRVNKHEALLGECLLTALLQAGRDFWMPQNRQVELSLLEMGVIGVRRVFSEGARLSPPRASL